MDIENQPIEVQIGGVKFQGEYGDIEFGKLMKSVFIQDLSDEIGKKLLELARSNNDPFTLSIDSDILEFKVDSAKFATVGYSKLKNWYWSNIEFGDVER